MSVIQRVTPLNEFESWNEKYQEYIPESSRTNLYALIPQLTVPTVPLKHNFTYCSDQAEEGDYSKVKFAFLHATGIKYAIKRPKEKNNLKSSLEDYEQNLVIGGYIGTHPNFIEVHALVLKARKQEKIPNVKPYLILSNLEKAKNPESFSKLDILSQVKTIALYLCECGVIAADISSSNFMITEEGKLVLFDYDYWRLPSETDNVASYAYSTAVSLFAELTQGLKIPYSPDSPIETKRDLEKAIDRLINAYISETTPSPCCSIQ